IHIFGHYYRCAALHPEKDQRTLVVEAVDAVRLPIIFAAVTTAMGFLSFGGASMPALQSFGIYTAFGVIAAMLLTLTYIPATLVLIPLEPRARAVGTADVFSRGILASALAAL